MTNAIDDKLASLHRLYARRDKLVAELDRSLALQKLWPECFAHGRVVAYAVGNPYSDVRFVIKAGNGEKREFPLGIVPKLLWPPELKERYESPNARRRYPGLFKAY